MVIQFTKDGIYGMLYDRDAEDDDNREMVLLGPRFNIKRFYNSVVLFEEDLTVGDFIRLIRPNASVIDQDFVAWSEEVSIKPFFREILKEKKEQPPFSFVEFRRVLNIDLTEKEDSENDYESNFYESEIYMNGVSLESDDVYFYNSSLYPMYNYKDLPIRINQFCLYTKIEDDPESEDGFSIEETIIPKEMTLHEVLSCLVYELTIYGTPSQRDRKERELRQKEEQENNQSNSNMTHEDVLIKNLEERLKREEEKENYLECFKIKKEIEVIKNKKNKKSKKKKK
jgi:hypothetical protein